MSQPYYSYTFAVPGSDLPDRFASEDAFLEFLGTWWAKPEPDFVPDWIPSTGFGIGGPREFVLQGITRNGWAHGVVADMAGSTRRLPALSFLVGSDQDQWVPHADGGGSGFKLNALGPVRIEAAALALDAVFQWIRTDPMALVDMAYGIDGAEVIEALASPTLSTCPAHDARVRGDEGNTYDYLFTWLRTVAYILRFAQGKSRHVVHAILWPG